MRVPRVHWWSAVLLAAGGAAWGAQGTPPAAAPPAPATPPAARAPSGAAEPLDYTTLAHRLSIDMLRAGSHDQSGTNEYFFSVAMYGLLSTAEERNLEFGKRKQVKVDLGRFGATKIDSLAVWRPDEKAKDGKELRIDGNQIRELAARTMTEFKAPEDDLTVMVEVTLLKRNKKFVFFGDDQRLASATYYPIPPTKFDMQLRTNQTLQITDDRGTNVRILVRYDKPAVAAAKKP